jgi:beta-lactamase class A
MSEPTLKAKIEAVGREAGATAVAVGCHDYEGGTSWAYHGDRWFHAASTIKVAVLLGVFAAAEQGRLSLDARVHVRNRFLSLADGRPFRVASDRDANSHVHEARGRTLKVSELAHHMIATSSNLATNLLLDVVGLDALRRTLDELELSEGIDLRRGVEDERAWERGENNRVTAAGLVAALRAIVERRAISPAASEGMLEILHAQQFRSGIPAGLPDGARVAHKTGEISSVAHDAGIVFPPDRDPYVLVVLTEWAPERGARDGVIAAISRAIYRHLVTEAPAGG